MTKKIGIISYHSDPNYGTMFQAFALAEVIKQNGGEPEYIQYETIPYRSPFKSVLVSVTKWFLKITGIRKRQITEYSFLKSKEFKGLIKKYNSFHEKYIPVSSKIYYTNTVSETSGEYDFILVGSDQTWSPACNVNPNTPNFLSFVKDKRKKRSYAPSIGSVHISDDYKSRLSMELTSFECLSCREYANARMLSSALGRNVQHVLDPTLLIQANEWKNIEQEVSMPERYILCYILGNKQCISDFAEHLSTAKGIPVYYMVTRPDYFAKQNKLVDISPEQFLWLLRHASYVVTDSFHGTMFSINFNRNFYSFAKRVTNDSTGLDNDRIMDFLKLVGLQNRFIDDDESRIEDDIDYSPVNRVLATARVKSLSYLTKTITE